MENKTTEKCIICGVDTGVPRNLNINARKHYIIGAGQLCEDCYKKNEKNTYSMQNSKNNTWW